MIDRCGSNSPNWKGGRTHTSTGYVLLMSPGHPRAWRDGYVLEHVLVAEAALGKPLPERAVVHHVNGIKTDNRPQNLVVCQDNGYHSSLHRRKRAFEECGHPDWRKCALCKKYDDPEIMKPHTRASVVHRTCRNEYHVNRRRKLRDVRRLELTC